MDAPAAELFGDFPRRVGVPRQWWVYAEEQFDMFYESVCGNRNAYATVSWFDRKLRPVSDKVAIDFDSPVKEPDWGWREAKRLQNDSEFRAEVLGDVCDDINDLANVLLNHNRAALGVFTGFGVHVHILYEPRTEPATAMDSTAKKVIDDVGLETVDRAPVGDAQRLMRVPNAQRIEDGEQTGIWTVPLTRPEMESVTPDRLLELAQEPRRGVTCEESATRPEMEVHNEYVRNMAAIPKDPRPTTVDFDDVDDEVLKGVLKDLLKMPCMYERIIQPEPSHTVRRNAAVLLFNSGLGVDDVFELFRQLGWQDWDPEVTRKQLRHLYSSGYSDMNCETLQREGLCVRREDPTQCSCFGWSGGKCEWR